MLEKYQYSNLIKRTNRFAQIVLAVSLALAVNHVAMHVYDRVDLRGQRAQALSAESLAYIRELREPVRIIHTTMENSPSEDERILHRYVASLASEYSFASRGNPPGARIATEHIDIYKDLSRARALAQRHDFDQPHSVLVVAGDPETTERRRIIPPDAILEFRDGQPSAFRGEQAITSAILEVTSDRRPRVYFTTGHGEKRLDDMSAVRGLSLLAAELRGRNFDVETLDLPRVREVPRDAELVVLAGPQGPLMPRDVEKLRNYLRERSGRVIAMVDPGVNHRMDDLFQDWGVLLDDKLVLERGSDYLEGTGSHLVRQFAEHPVTQVLIDNQTPVVAGLTRPARRDPGAPPDERLHVTELMASSAESWAESAYRSAVTATFDPAADLPGPVSVAVAAERRASAQLGIAIPGGRLVAFGSADLFTNRRITGIGNFRLFLGAVNWALDRDELLAIPPRPIERYRITASQSQLRRVGWLFLAVPGSLALLGLAVYSMRRF